MSAPAAASKAPPPPPRATWSITFATFMGYALLMVWGHLRDLCGYLTGSSRYPASSDKTGPQAPLLKSWENFYTRRMYHRVQDCWNRPIVSAPGARVDVVLRESLDGNKTLQCTDMVQAGCVNLGSYNYLGFADDWMETCGDAVLTEMENYPIAMSSARMDVGTVKVHRQLENEIARFLGKEDALVFTMGYGTNSTTIPSLVGKGCLVISDELNHTSIVNGCRAANTKILTFQHNDARHLEEILREAIALGQPRTHRPWRKILVIVEGIYSMEGEICNLRAIVNVCKKYRAYVYLDDAHSIGALGRTGRGACEHAGVSSSEIDVMMGTFTKSFGAMGGYIAGSKELIAHLRVRCPGIAMHNAMSPVICAQVRRALAVISGADGTDLGARKLQALRENSNYARAELIKMGCHVLGDYDSPVIPVMIYLPGRVGAISRLGLARKLALVVVGFPATPLLLARSRICISAAHTRQDLEEALEMLEELTYIAGIQYARKGPRHKILKQAV